MWDSFKKGFKIGINCFLGSYTCLVFFFVIGTAEFLNLYIKEFSLLSLLSFFLCIYNTYWISGAIQIRKSFQKSTLKVLVHDTSSDNSTKKFVADLIFSIFWKDVYNKKFKDDLEQEQFIDTVVIESIKKYNENSL